MDTINQITKVQLPPHQDFSFLKDEAIDYIQKHIGNEWTNFNPSDPGMTILDQLCYALTELGYCTDFPISDILTDSNGKLEIENQFYLPYKILTTAPYTINDYKKYLIDGVNDVYNVAIITYNNNLPQFNRVYQVYLYVNPEITDALKLNKICKSAYYYLNQSRNIGELFNIPIALQAQKYLISGKIELESEVDEHAVLLELQNKIRAYIFPKIEQLSYDSLKADGYDSAEIYDGPYLKNGWILNDTLVDKKDTLRALDLIPVIESVSGIISISGLQFFQNNTMIPSLQSTISQILSIDILKSYKENKLILTTNGKDVPVDNFIPIQIDTIKYQETATSLNNKPAIKLPKSSFRDINSYYSIQNTFPQQYGIGDDKIEDDSAPIQVAQSRQLKGYLTLFDQVLANQFSQLANLSKLFSFNNSVCGAPSDNDSFYALKDKFEQKHLEYPVPYKMFSPSYFYQSLYNVPHIKPLLKNNTAFDFSSSEETKKEMKEKSWFEYQQDPYNAYIFGMMKIMEEEDINFDRRNKLLDHLLARHGEAPKVIDTIIDGTIYTGNKKKDQIIVKSLYLQNLDLLSYNRLKGYNFLSASKILTINNQNIDLNLGTIKKEHFDYINENTNDFIFKSNHLNQKEKLHKSDFINFSGFELKLNLLFGLKNIYYNFISTQIETSAKSIENKLTVSKTIQKAYWFKEKRNGSIFIETAILLSKLKYHLEIVKQSDNTFYSIQNTDYQSIANVNYILATTSQTVLDIQVAKGYLEFSNEKYALIPDESQTVIDSDYIKNSSSDYLFKITVISGNGTITINDTLFKKNAIVLLPDFIPEFKKSEFKKRLKQFLNISFPTSIKYECLFVSLYQLETFTSVYSNWHECLTFKTPNNSSDTQQDNPQIVKPLNQEFYAVNLINSLTQILETKNGRNK
ncbi:hypothetical protein C8C83_4201 [Flavobacterium sp. 90]|uniref:hypothetical protein n=1 Tax=unclassified Flavobacterium TaxID=196869 RepID=UPI000EB2C955|nr:MULTISPECIES: hypothetical protein [unclassified Flavobacterium]RKR04868.1 hypothetical protein C8C82_4534 [Flavobacterium sp. 81]TCK56189.1 hypothetical protein C8C83_4201 [Flavobacterium sp. 90]